MRLKNETFGKQVDKTTGEITDISTSKTFSTRVTPDKFFMTFVEKTASFYNIKSLVAVKLLSKMLELSEYNTGRVLITSDVRKELANQLEISTQQFTNSIKHLKDIGIIDGSRGTYFLNANIYWKGTLDARTNFLNNGGTLSFNVEFSIDNNV